MSSITIESDIGAPEGEWIRPDPGGLSAVVPPETGGGSGNLCVSRMPVNCGSAGSGYWRGCLWGPTSLVGACSLAAALAGVSADGTWAVTA
jgi:hypothetical protein